MTLQAGFVVGEDEQTGIGRDTPRWVLDTLVDEQEFSYIYGVGNPYLLLLYVRLYKAQDSRLKGSIKPSHAEYE